MADTVQTKQTKGTYRYMCGTPDSFCQGAKKGVSAFAKAGVRLHGSSREARNCYKAYLMTPDGGGYVPGDDAGSMVDPTHQRPAIALTKTTRFGARMRPGKAGRNMPCGHSSGVVISK